MTCRSLRLPDPYKFLGATWFTRWLNTEMRPGILPEGHFPRDRDRERKKKKKKESIYPLILKDQELWVIT